ncbi:MAG: VanW family protein [Tissierellia bacterium]|nr:VanW family protein [Tissierellia bacterium]
MSESILRKSSFYAILDSIMYPFKEKSKNEFIVSEKAEKCDILLSREESNLINRNTSNSIVYQYNNKKNIEEAVKALNGYTIYPHSIFSFTSDIYSKCKHKIYREGLEIDNHREVIDYGQGLSQLITQLFMTLLNSKMAVVEHKSSVLRLNPYRSNYPYGFTTSIDDTWDLKFDNQFEDTYSIKAYIKDDVLITELYTNSRDIERVELKKYNNKEYREDCICENIIINRFIYYKNSELENDEVLKLSDRRKL